MVATIYEAFESIKSENNEKEKQNKRPKVSRPEDPPVETTGSEKPPVNPESEVEVVAGFRNRCGKRETFTNGFDFNGMITKIVKYLIEGITVSLVGMILLMNKNGGKGKYTTQAMEIIAMGVSAAAVFAILDTFAPAVSMSTRQGAGFGLGANLVGFPA